MGKMFTERAMETSNGLKAKAILNFGYLLRPLNPTI